MLTYFVILYSYLLFSNSSSAISSASRTILFTTFGRIGDKTEGFTFAYAQQRSNNVYFSGWDTYLYKFVILYSAKGYLHRKILYRFVIKFVFFFCEVFF